MTMSPRPRWCSSVASSGLVGYFGGHSAATTDADSPSWGRVDHAYFTAHYLVQNVVDFADPHDPWRCLPVAPPYPYAAPQSHSARSQFDYQCGPDCLRGGRDCWDRFQSSAVTYSTWDTDSWISSNCLSALGSLNLERCRRGTTKFWYPADSIAIGWTRSSVARWKLTSGSWGCASRFDSGC